MENIEAADSEQQKLNSGEELYAELLHWKVLNAVLAKKRR